MNIMIAVLVWMGIFLFLTMIYLSTKEVSLPRNKKCKIVHLRDYKEQKQKGQGNS